MLIKEIESVVRDHPLKRPQAQTVFQMRFSQLGLL